MADQMYWRASKFDHPTNDFDFMIHKRNAAGIGSCPSLAQVIRGNQPITIGQPRTASAIVHRCQLSCVRATIAFISVENFNTLHESVWHRQSPYEERSRGTLSYYLMVLLANPSTLEGLNVSRFAGSARAPK